MHIALFHWDRIPPRTYGGIERVIVWLARGLVELGHEVTLIAAPGSLAPGARLVEIETKRARADDFEIEAYLPAGVDIVYSPVVLPRVPAVPWVHHLHVNSPPGHRRGPNTVYLSADHARRHGATAYVHNGLDPAELTFRAAKGDFDLFLGRLHSIKGWRWAVEGCRRTGRRLVVAGGWRPTLRRGLRFVGQVGGSEKAELLAGARLLWMPALWDEPFGLTLIEALASGTPVLCTRRGALPEVITPEVGVLGDTLEELVDGLGGIPRIDPEACRARVERHFHYRVMAAGHLRMMRGFLRDGVLPAGRLLDGPDSAARD